MLNNKIIEYPALIYKKNNMFIADCVMFNLIAIAKSEIEAIENLQKSINEQIPEFDILIKPVYRDNRARISN